MSRSGLVNPPGLVIPSQEQDVPKWRQEPTFFLRDHRVQAVATPPPQSSVGGARLRSSSS